MPPRGECIAKQRLRKRTIDSLPGEVQAIGHHDRFNSLPGRGSAPGLFRQCDSMIADVTHAMA